jgi:hypothetical protein
MKCLSLAIFAETIINIIMILRKFSSYQECLEFVEYNKVIFKTLYIKRDMTARKVAENQNIYYDNNFQKALLRVCGSKGMGLGGSRIGSGKKKIIDK